jgi:hypothetical protein
MCASRRVKPELGSLNHMARGPRRKSRMIRRSTQLIVETAGITEITSSNLHIRWRRDCSIFLLMQGSGAKFIIPLDTIWKSAKLFLIVGRCHHQHRWPRNPVEVNITESIPTMRIRWRRTT